MTYERLITFKTKYKEIEACKYIKRYNWLQIKHNNGYVHVHILRVDNRVTYIHTFS